jgi:DNA invertase Pin-like site-specific DNA recombinase
MQPIRTISEISVHINIMPAVQIPIYKMLSNKVKRLRTLGMSFEKIARELNISESTVIRAHRFYNSRK